MNLTGRCACGAVSFAAQDVDPDIHACHCRTCQRWLGGPALGVGVGSVAFEGREHVATYDSSAWAERGFCRQCGSSLFYRLKERDHYVLFTGTFDNSDGLALSGEIFVDEKPPGYDFAGDHARLTGAQFWQSLQQT